MTTIKSATTLVFLITALLKANSLNIIDSQTLQKILNEIYFQPYAEFSKQALYHRFPDFDNFKSNGDKKIALQIGHLLEEQLPLELIYLGTSGGAKVERLKEVEINQAIAEKVKNVLETQIRESQNAALREYKVELLNALIPPAYYADVFVALHANVDKKNVSGFLISAPYKDYSAKAAGLKNAIMIEYAKFTGMKYIDYQSQNMTRYYSFNWSKFKRAIHPKTPAVILETGNLKNFDDLVSLTLNQDKVAQGIANGIMKFLNENSERIIR